MRESFLKKYYLKDEKLAQRAKLEFYRAMSTNRMVAFVGSMATEAFGYGDWDRLAASFAKEALGAVQQAQADLKKKQADPRTHALGDQIADIKKQVESFHARSTNNQWPVQVGLSLVQELVARLPDTRPKGTYDWSLDNPQNLTQAMRANFAARFREPRSDWGVGESALEDTNALRRLWVDLGIRRFITTNYDFEIERLTMAPDCAWPDSPFDDLRAMRGSANENFSWDLGSGRIRRVFADGWAVESDLLNRERIDRMIEFAIGADDVDGHILHVHGRACDWRSMIVTHRDYDRLYRRNDLNRAPFEFAKRLMMGGNPILFVGLGMKEEDLNRDLREFISNNPYQRVAPTFLLWSSSDDTERQAAMRVKFLSELGVLTIFDGDLGEGADLLPTTAPKPTPDKVSLYQIDTEKAYAKVDTAKAPELKRLTQSVSSLAAGLAEKADPIINPALRHNQIGDAWRTMEGRIEAAAAAGQPVVLWDVVRKESPPPDTPPPLAPHWFSEIKTSQVLCVIGAQGAGKGSAARALTEASAAELGLRSRAHCMMINGCFSFDTDTVLDGIARFLSKTFATPYVDHQDHKRPLQSRSSFFEQLDLGRPAPDGVTALIVINGMERFIDTGGEPLSAELDELLAQARQSYDRAGGRDQPKVRWVIFGTERVRRYMGALGAKVCDFQHVPPSTTGGSKIPGKYLKAVWAGVEEMDVTMPAALRQEVERYEANRSGRISGDSIEMRAALFGELFHDHIFRALLARTCPDPDPALGREILKALAFIGIPIEFDVLDLMPALHGKPRLQEHLDALRAAQLVLTLESYRPPPDPSREETSPPNPRYALHRSLLTELRYRYGIPLSEAKLSTAFNMSLYVAQPIDGDIPDTDIHDDLGDAIDQLVGSYRLPDPGPKTVKDRAEALGVPETAYQGIFQGVAIACGASDQKDGWKDMERLCGPRHAQALRTALALVRSYYTTTGLLTLDTGARLLREGHDGVLLEHAERLDDLIDAYGKVCLARKAFQKILARRKLKFKVPDASHLSNIEPFYADELVWLHNELGVVRLAMGDLYEARRSFDQALLINRQWVERDERSHNWRRIRLNQITVDVEMGQIGLAKRKCEEIIQVSKAGVHLREDRLAVALATGLRGWCLHLRGQADRAIADYAPACEALSQLGEIRAQAYVERLYANALGMLNRPDERRSRLETALDLAQSAVQMDIVHRLQVTLAESYLFGSDTSSVQLRQRAHRHLDDALTYALHTQVHRVRCEASTVTAQARLGMADFDGALRYATDALMVATRYGMELRKVSLRALIAKIMAQRGHPVTAGHLARSCIKAATRQRYQTAIDEASRVIADIPQMSAAIMSSDRSGQRTF